MILTIEFRYGRKKTSIVALFLHVILPVILSVSPNYWFYVIFVLLMGVVHIMVYNTAFIWCKFIIFSLKLQLCSAYYSLCCEMFCQQAGERNSFRKLIFECLVPGLIY